MYCKYTSIVKQNKINYIILLKCKQEYNDVDSEKNKILNNLSHGIRGESKTVSTVSYIPEL